jgi:hypothetical protein
VRSLLLPLQCSAGIRNLLEFQLGFHQMLEEAKKQCNHRFFMKFFMLMAWLI